MRRGGMKRLRWILAYIGGGLAFWLPGLVAQAIRGNQFGSSLGDLIGVNILSVIAPWVALELLDRKRSGQPRRGTIALWMLLGIWVLGPLCITIGASFLGDEFTWLMMLRSLILLLPLTLMMSVYQGTIIALALITVWFLLAGIISLSKR